MEAGQHLDGGGLPGSVRPEKTEDLSGPDPERDAVDGNKIAEDLGESLDPDRVSHRGSLRVRSSG